MLPRRFPDGRLDSKTGQGGNRNASIKGQKHRYCQLSGSVSRVERPASPECHAGGKQKEVQESPSVRCVTSSSSTSRPATLRLDPRGSVRRVHGREVAGWGGERHPKRCRATALHKVPWSAPARRRFGYGGQAGWCVGCRHGFYQFARHPGPKAIRKGRGKSGQK